MESRGFQMRLKSQLIKGIMLIDGKDIERLNFTKFLEHVGETQI